MKLDDFGIKQYLLEEKTAIILRESLLESEPGLISLGKSIFNYPEDQITGKQQYYNLLHDLETWEEYCFPRIKEIVADFLTLTPGEVVHYQSWGNILRMDNKIFPHRHFGTPDNYNTNPQSVSGNLFLGSENPTATTYILGGEKIDIPNEFGQFTLFPPSLPHAVRSYKGEGVRVSAAFDCFIPSRDPEGRIRTTNQWYTWTHK